ncbi:Vanillate monooxygenase [Sphingomonas paucimobilis]|nr:Vanillate monooxygenase [Sphingomonas paucimobilis]
MFLKNCWYLAAWADELQPGAMLARQIAGEHVLFMRGEDDGVSALADLCPHRFVPLSMGSYEEGRVTCAYHGLRFDGHGKCIHNPHGPISAALSVRSYPFVERHAALWLWLGEAELADPALITDLTFIDETAPEARVKGRLHSQADYRVMVDNIMDLTHADYLHASTLGGGINTIAKADVEQDGGAITITWTAEDEVVPPMMRGFTGHADGVGDFLNRIAWHAPSIMVQDVNVGSTGSLKSGRWNQTARGCHVMTPETETSTHYFFMNCNSSTKAHPETAPMVRAALVDAFSNEDAPISVAQTQRIAGRDFWSLRPAMLPSDKGAVLVRRALDRMIADEAQRLVAA